MVYCFINRNSLPVRATAAVAGGVSRAFVFATFFILALLVSRFAHASGDTIADVATNIDTNTYLIPDFIAYLMYIAGAAMVVWGLLDIRGYVESPSQKHLRTGLSKIGLAAFLLSLPFAANVILNTLIGGILERFFASAPIIQHVDAPAGADRSGEGGFWDLVKQVSVTGNFMPSFFNYAAYIGGTGLLAYGLFGLRRSVEDGGRNPIKNPIAQLVAAGLLLSVPFAASVIYYTMTYDIAGDTEFTSGAYRFTGETAGTLGDLVYNTIENASVLPKFAVYLAYIIGTYFTIRAILMFKDNVTDPSRTPIVEPMKRMGVGGLCFGLPYAVDVVINSFVLTSVAAETNTKWAIDNVSTGGLDGMFMALAKSTVNPLLMSIEIFCYIAGFMMVLFAIQRLTQTMQQGAKGPLGFGTISMFIVAASLLSFPHFMGILGNTVFGSTNAMTYITFMDTGGAFDADLEQNAKNVISACIAFVGVIGYLSVVRGLFIFKAYADGGQGTLFGATVHMIAGIIAVNLGQFVNIIQKSLGLSSLGIEFS